VGKDLFQVIVCVLLRDEAGRVLLTRRKADKKLGGFWEFPGGKLEYGEDLVMALKREIREELGVEIEVARLLHVKPHIYEHAAVLILFYEGRITGGTVQLTDHDTFVWLTPAELTKQAGLLPANQEVIKMLF
jgi:8-oxo-dGTP diphosphatase